MDPSWDTSKSNREFSFPMFPQDIPMITPWKINGWNLQITHLEREMIFQTSMVMFHVNLQGCTGFLNHHQQYLSPAFQGQYRQYMNRRGGFNRPLDAAFWATFPRVGLEDGAVYIYIYIKYILYILHIWYIVYIIYIYIFVIIYVAIAETTRKRSTKGGNIEDFLWLDEYEFSKIISGLLEDNWMLLLKDRWYHYSEHCSWILLKKHGVMGAVGGAGHARPGEICDHDSHLRPEEISQEQGR